MLLIPVVSGDERLRCVPIAGNGSSTWACASAPGRLVSSSSGRKAHWSFSTHSGPWESASRMITCRTQHPLKSSQSSTSDSNRVYAYRDGHYCVLYYFVVGIALEVRRCRESVRNGDVVHYNLDGAEVDVCCLAIFFGVPRRRLRKPSMGLRRHLSGGQRASAKKRNHADLWFFDAWTHLGETLPDRRLGSKS